MLEDEIQAIKDERDAEIKAAAAEIHARHEQKLKELRDRKKRETARSRKQHLTHTMICHLTALEKALRAIPSAQWPIKIQNMQTCFTETELPALGKCELSIQFTIFAYRHAPAPEVFLELITKQKKPLDKKVWLPKQEYTYHTTEHITLGTMPNIDIRQWPAEAPNLAAMVATYRQQIEKDGAPHIKWDRMGHTPIIEHVESYDHRRNPVHVEGC